MSTNFFVKIVVNSGILLLTASPFVQAQAQTAQAVQLDVTSEEVPGEVIVKLKHPEDHAESQRVMKAFRTVGKFHQSSKALRMHHMKLASGFSAHDVIDKLNKDAAVEYAEPNFVIRLSQTSGDTGAPRVLSSSDVAAMDSGNSIQGGSGTYTQSSAATQVKQSWSAVTGSNTVIVAVVDTGVDYTHSVLTGSSAIWSNTGEVASNGIDDDHNGFVDDTRGWNFYSGTNNPMDDNGHGTHVSGIIIGVAQDIFAGTLSVSPIKIMPLKFMGADGTGNTSAAVSAIDYAVGMGAKVINNSWGGSSYSQSLHDALAYAYANHLTIASAAGNYSANDDASPIYPANLPVPSQISVAATDNSDVLASFFSYGPSTVHVSAPGVSILSLYPNNSYAYLSGTSMATPFVAGLAAMAYTQATQLTGYQIKNIVIGNGNVISDLSGLVSTGSRVNALLNVQAAQANSRTVASQPSYVANVPAGVNVGTSSTTTGCGLVGGPTLQIMLNGAGGGSGPNATIFLSLMMLPLLVWFVIRQQYSQGVHRRKYDRFSISSQVRLLIDGQQVEGRLSSIGLGGLAFSADANLAKGGALSMQVQGPDGRDIQVVGRVVWNGSNNQYGVQFAPMQSSVLRQIQSWTSQLVKQS